MRSKLFTFVFSILLTLPAWAQKEVYDIIPQPQTISIDAKGRMLDISEATPIQERQDPKIANAEGWRLTVDKQGITLEGSTDAGIFYARQALRQIMAGKPSQLPYAVVESAPRFAYRGMHLDICRHFFGKDVVKSYLDMMALHGMNTLHWHLTEDQGWRIEIKKWPRLTQIGAWRDRTVIGRNMGLYDRTMHGGYYTQKDIREIVDYAAQRHITIIPEIDMPGHMVAALTAYPELGCTGGPYEVWPDWGVSEDILCAGNPRVYQFLEDVLTEVMALFPSKIIHLGGDEAPKVRWKSCPRCQQKIRDEHLEGNASYPAEERLQGYMVRRMEQFLSQHGRVLMGWDEIMYCDVPKTSVIMNWRDSQGIDDPAQKGFDVVRTPNSTLYFDYYQIPSGEWTNTTLIGGYSPLDKVYNYEPVADSLTTEQKAHVLGVQANLWTEYIGSADLIEYQVLPRMAALAEVQWVSPGQKDYDHFMQRLPRLLGIYQEEGWHYCKYALRK
ncbi:MAG: beta-N-acetylhexosaminidase [Prevotella sp.]|nr:beta-N-acetylhexosaminidase [Prevotella sp.]